MHQSTTIKGPQVHFISHSLSHRSQVASRHRGPRRQSRRPTIGECADGVCEALGFPEDLRTRWPKLETPGFNPWSSDSHWRFCLKRLCSLKENSKCSVAFKEIQHVLSKYEEVQPGVSQIRWESCTKIYTLSSCPQTGA